LDIPRRGDIIISEREVEVKVKVKKKFRIEGFVFSSTLTLTSTLAVFEACGDSPPEKF
jgi:hypothetical protein